MLGCPNLLGCLKEVNSMKINSMKIRGNSVNNVPKDFPPKRDHGRIIHK
jgi:hypothetical protein